MSRTEKIVLGGVLAAMGVSWTWMASPASAEQDTVESVALEIARQHNQSASAMLDEMTLSTSARAIGKNVVLTYVIRVQRGLSEQNLAEFKTELEREIVPAACKENADNEAFKKGLFYTFVYRNTYDEELAEVIVNRDVCEGQSSNSRPTEPIADADWVKFAENERLVAYYEPRSQRDNGRVVVWVLYDYKSEQESPRSGRMYFSQKGQQEVDCRGARSRTIFFTWHAGRMGDGIVVYTGFTPLPWEPNSPASIARALSSAVCG